MLRITSKFSVKIFVSFIILSLISIGDIQAKKKKSKKNTNSVISEAELQGQMMAFADRYWSIMSSVSREYLANSPSPENLREIRTQLTYSAVDAYTIAADPKPVAAFLDMVVMVTLGRMIFEQHYLKLHGAEVAPLAEGLQKAEADIWEIAGILLTKQQQDELMGLIEAWRRDHSEVVVFSRVRFSEFEKVRGISDVSDKKSASGIFKSVAKVTEQVEEARLLAERGMYLGTRLPLLTGALASTWTSNILAHNPDVNQVTSNLDRISAVSERLAVVAENLPDDISKERQASIEQLLDRISEERKQTINQVLRGVARERRKTIEEFVAEEKKLRGLLTDLKLTMETGNQAVVSISTLVERLNLGQKKASTATPSEPFDIKDYQATLREATHTIVQVHELVKTVDQLGLEKSIPQIFAAIDQFEQRGEKWVLQAFMLGVMLILILLIGAVFSMILYRYMIQRMFAAESRKAAS